MSPFDHVCFTAFTAALVVVLVISSLTFKTSLSADETQVKTSRISGTKGAFSVSWRGSPEASCGYIVDWYPVEDPWSVDWMKLPPNQTSANITSSRSLMGSSHSCMCTPIVSAHNFDKNTPTFIAAVCVSCQNTWQMDADTFCRYTPAPGDLQCWWRGGRATPQRRVSIRTVFGSQSSCWLSSVSLLFVRNPRKAVSVFEP